MQQRDAPPASSLTPSATSGPDRLPTLLGVLVALLLLGGWWYPAGAFPRQHLAIDLCLAPLAVVAALRGGFWRRREPRPRVVVPAGVWTLLLLAAYVVARGGYAEGAEWRTAVVWSAFAAIAGTAVGGALRADAGAFLTALRRTLACGAVAFAMFAWHQYFVGYPRSLEALRASLAGPVADLHTQSLLHALEERRVAGRLGNPNLFAAQLALLAVFCIGTLCDRRALWRVLGGFGWMAATGALWMTGSRGGLLTWLAATGGGALTLKLRSGRHPAADAAAVAAMAAGFFAFAQVAHAAAGILERLGRVDTIRERLFYWEIAVRVWLDHPLLGGGAGAFEHLYPILKSPMARDSRHAHSWIFQYGADGGLIGVALLGGFWLLVLRGWWCGVRRGRAGAAAGRAEAVWPLLGVLVLAFNGLFEFALQWRSFLVAVGMLGGLGLTLTAAPLRSRCVLRTAADRALPAVAPVLMLAAAVPLASYDRAVAAHWEYRTAVDDARWSDALRAIERAHRLAPRDAQYLLEWATAEGRLGNRERFLERLDLARRMNPDSAAVRAVFARYFESAGDPERALESWGEAIERFPSRVEHRLARARLLLRLGRTNEAREDLLYIERENVPVCEFEREPYNDLRVQTGLEPVEFPE